MFAHVKAGVIVGKFNSVRKVRKTILLRNPYFVRNVSLDNCDINTEVGDVVIDRDLSVNNTGYYWVESELTDKISDCVSYCNKPYRMHFNRYSDDIVQSNIPYFEILNHPKIRQVRFQNQMNHMYKVKTVLVLISSCNWRNTLVNNLENSNLGISFVKEGKCYNRSSHDRLNFFSTEDLISVSNFKYYFAVENSECENYVSEKIHKAFLTGVTPIIYNISNYRNVINKELLEFVWDIKRETTPKKVDLPSEQTLQRFYSNWKSDYEKLCESSFPKQRDYKVTECVDSCRRNFDCVSN